MFQKAVVLWMNDPVTRDAKILAQALRGSLTDHKAVTEVICTRTTAQLRQIKQVYSKDYGTTPEHDIESKCYGDHKRVISSHEHVKFFYKTMRMW